MKTKSFYGKAQDMRHSARRNIFVTTWPCVYGLYLESIKPVTNTNLCDEEMKK